MLVPADRKHEEPQILERLRRGERIDHFAGGKTYDEGALAMRTAFRIIWET